MYSEYYGEYRDYTRKRGVIFTEIILPENAPAEYQDRATLWNAVEKAERGKTAQLAYSFDIALQNELTMEENIALARQFVREQFVAKGMIVDLAVHAPDKDGGIQNPHFHVLCPIRPLNNDGTWGKKQRRVYKLDADGNRILDEKGKPKFDAVPTTDWGQRSTLESWRAAWAELVNAKFAEKKLDCQIDHRSNKARGIEKAPTVHEGPVVRQGKSTNKGELNRWIKENNSLLSILLRKLADLMDWIKTVREKLRQSRQSDLAQLLIACLDYRNSRAWSSSGRTRNLQDLSKIVIYLLDNDIGTLDELLNKVKSLEDKVQALKNSMKDKSDRKKKLRNLLSADAAYQKLKPLFDEMNAIKWKGRREKFRAEHQQELRQFYAVRRLLKENSDAEGKYSTAAWKMELAKLDHERQAEYEQYKEINENYQHLLQVQYWVDTAIQYQQGEEQRRTQEQSQVYYQQQAQSQSGPR